MDMDRFPSFLWIGLGPVGRGYFTIPPGQRQGAPAGGKNLPYNSDKVFNLGGLVEDKKNWYNIIIIIVNCEVMM